MSFVENQLQKFQKLMWSNEKPLLYAVDVVHALLLENDRLRRLVEEQTVDREEFNESVRQKLDFRNFEKGEN